MYLQLCIISKILICTLLDYVYKNVVYTNFTFLLLYFPLNPRGSIQTSVSSRVLRKTLLVGVPTQLLKQQKCLYAQLFTCATFIASLST